MQQAKLTGVAPILIVRDVQASADYWRDKLGFSFARLWGEPPNFCMPHRDGMIIMLSQAPAGHQIVPHWRINDQLWNAYFWVDDAEKLFAEFTERGAVIDYDLGKKPYGVLEFGVQDLDGHDIAFGEDVE